MDRRDNFLGEFFGLPQYFLGVLNSLAEYKRQLTKEQEKLADLVVNSGPPEEISKAKQRITRISSIINHFSGPAQAKAKSRPCCFVKGGY